MYQQHNEIEKPQKRSQVVERLLNADWEDLADRSIPLPEGVTPEMVMQHFGRMLLMQYNDKFGNLTRGGM